MAAGPTVKAFTGHQTAGFYIVASMSVDLNSAVFVKIFPAIS